MYVPKFSTFSKSLWLICWAIPTRQERQDDDGTGDNESFWMSSNKNNIDFLFDLNV